jgi:hypothetical protein
MSRSVFEITLNEAIDSKRAKFPLNKEEMSLAPSGLQSGNWYHFATF